MCLLGKNSLFKELFGILGFLLDFSKRPNFTVTVNLIFDLLMLIELASKPKALACNFRNVEGIFASFFFSTTVNRSVF